MMSNVKRLGALLGLALAVACQAKEAGIFYSTLYAKTMEPQRLSGFGGDATAWFLADVNGDRRDDAVVYYGAGAQRGQWRVALWEGESFAEPNLAGELAAAPPDAVALMGDVDGDARADACLYVPQMGAWVVLRSEGAGFADPTVFAKSGPAGGEAQFLADINGDGKADAVVAQLGEGEGCWLAGLSTGRGFAEFEQIGGAFGRGADRLFLADVNGDRWPDAVAYDKQEGAWTVALAERGRFGESGVWRRDFGTEAGLAFVCDVDGDRKADIGYVDAAAWFVSYSDGAKFGEYRHRWLAGFGERGGRGGAKQNPPPVLAHLTGRLAGRSAWACVVDEFGRWFAVENSRKNKTVDMTRHNTWFAWRCAYLPQIPGREGTYDSGDPAVHDVQLQMIHDAGFTYVTLDITNGYHDWVDDRAVALMKRIRRWNENLKPGQHKLYVNIALGRTRGVEGRAAWFEKLNLECKRAWEEFYEPFKDIYYALHGKPLVIHMISNGIRDGFYKEVDAWDDGDRTYIDKVTCRWMTGWGGCTEERANFYGWDVCEKFGNPIHQEMMPVMPGFWNGGTFQHREGGEYYRSHWMRVIKHQPDSVWLNSLNETWEHTSVEPAYMFNTREPHKGITMWTDLHGERMDDFYWVMTCQYMKLYMDDALYENTYFQEHRSDGAAGPIYKATRDGFVLQKEKPRRAPVLLLPEGFRAGFKGRVTEAPASYLPQGAATETPKRAEKEKL